MESLSQRQIRQLKSAAQRLEATLKIGKQGLTEPFVQSLSAELERHELVKIKLTSLKDQKHELAPELARRTQSCLVTLLGHTAVLFRPHPDPARRKFRL